MPTYRVFVDRHYVAVEFYDIEAPTAEMAEKAAKKAVNKLIPDARAMAVDNRWSVDSAVEIPNLGYSSAPFEVEQVFKHKDCIVYRRKGKNGS